jgi:cbb3-type cytochrome c oxidase subunit III
MLRKLKFVVFLSFFAFAVFGLGSRSFANLLSPSRPTGEQTATTREVFSRNCARCHGLDGKGQTEQGRKYDVPDLTTELKQASSAKIVRVITHGKLDMPAFGKKLTKKQIKALASYVKRL